jgi:DNA-directed RNA polymerase
LTQGDDLKKIDPAALGKLSGAKRQANACKHNRAVYQRIREYGDVSNKEAARRLTTEGVPKIRGKGAWTATDIRKLYVHISAVYGLDLDAADLQRLNEEADRHENTRRAAQGKRALFYDEWRFVEAAPRPPLRFTNPDDSQEAKGKLDHLRKARRLLKEETSVMAIAPSLLETIEDNEQRQLWNERLGLSLGRRKYHWNRLTQPLADSAIGNAIIEEFTPTLRKKIEKRVAGEGVPPGEPDVQKLLGLIDAEAVARIVIHRALVEFGNGFDRKHPLSWVVNSIAKVLREEAAVSHMKQQHPAFARKVEKDSGPKAIPKVKRSNLLKVAARHGVDPFREFKIDPVLLGEELLGALISSNGIAETVQKPGSSESTMYLQPAPEMIGFIARYDAGREDADPVHFPMIVKPKPWSGLVGGGFLNEQRDLVDTRSKEQCKALAGDPMPKVYEAINALQATPFRINRRVLEVAEVVKIEEGITALRAIEDETINEDKKKRKKLQQALEVTYRQLSLTNKFKEEPEIYFVWEMDFRSRMYSSIHDPLHPQANDAGRALLEFSKGVALGVRGAYWLAVHGANCYGMDKVSIRDRVRWVKENTPAILKSVDHPLDGDYFWREADDPYQFLAFCFEWADMVRSGSPKTFISRIPVAFDGSCNAYQHFAAMMQDEDLLQKVNVEYVSPVPWSTPSPFADKPGDLYQGVANVLTGIVEADAAEGKEEAHMWQGKISRKIVKPGVMTKAYGATSWGRKEQLEEVLEKLGENEVSGNRLAIRYLEGQLSKAIAKCASAADQAMEQLRDAARQHVKKGLPVRWTTPAGFTVLQDYRNKRGMPNLRKHTASISANYVHSLDASHMMLTIGRCLKKGIVDFAAIHDSYATHAANARTLRREITAAFWDQYRSGVYDPERGPILMRGLEWPEVEYYEEYEPPGIPEGMDPFK